MCGVMTTKIEYSKLTVALEYLEAAIEEREIHQRYFAAMNLAGVAEELLGKMIRVTGKTDQLTTVVNLVSKIQENVKDHFNLGFENKKELKKILGSSKNSIKHMDSENDSNAKLFFKVEDESIWQIRAAIRNLNILEIPQSVAVSKFIAEYPEESLDENKS